MICFAGCLPPPVHGMANVNADMIRRLGQLTSVRVYPVMPGRRAGVTRHLVKLARAVRALFGIASSRLAGARIFYGSADQNLGAFYTAAFALMARFAGMRVFLHHHSFLYVDRRLLPMRVLTRAAGPGACHVMLCNCMAEKFGALYPTVRSTMSVPNAIEAPDPPAPTGRGRSDELVVGLLSNLSIEKGLLEFIRLVEEARNRGFNLRGVLAGPPSDAGAQARIENAKVQLGSALEWLGPVHGEDKERFFSEIDVFVFPTRYKTEAYPLVLIEALLRGRPVITIDRGCIGEIGSLASCTVHSREEDFVAASLPQLSIWLERPHLLAEAAEQASREGKALNDANRAAIDKLANAIATGGVVDA